ncbi:MAG: SBBP repeat-containing protein [Peptostreptococcaceae bacterium]
MNNKSNILSNIPFTFEKNIGQYDKNVKFVLKNGTNTTFFTQEEIVIVFAKVKEENTNNQNDRLNNTKEYETSVLRLTLENSNQYPEIIGVNEFDCKINYIKGNDENDWNLNVPIYEKIIYKDIYNGIDLVYYENQGKLEHDFVVSPNANINSIEISFDGADDISLDNDKNVLINIKDHTIAMLRPKVYQYINDTEIEIDSSFLINNNNVTFDISDYNKNEVLIIDPVLMYGSYIGGSNVDEGFGIDVDNNQIAYITGTTYSTDFPIKNAYQSALQGATDIFLVKIDTRLNGTNSLLYSSYIGGDNSDTGISVAVDNNQHAYITGNTYSTNFPIKNAYQSSLEGINDAYLVKIDTVFSGASSLLYSTYLGGNDSDYGYGVAVDNSQIAYITGETLSPNFPTFNAYQNTLQGIRNAFLVKINTNLVGVNSLLYSTYFGGIDSVIGRDVAVDNNQNAYFVGRTDSINFPTKNSYQSTLQGSVDAFLVKINTNLGGLSSLIYSTYLGGNNYDAATSVSVDNNQNAYITGVTDSTNFPTFNAYQNINPGNDNAFLVKIDTHLSGVDSLLYSTYLGGSNSDTGYGVSVDNIENAYITGITTSTNFPLKYPYQSTFQGTSDAFLTKIDTKLIGSNSLVYSTYLGGNNSVTARDIAIDTNKNAYITGYTDSTNFPVRNAYQSTLQGATDAFIIKLNTLLTDLVLEKSSCQCMVTVGEKIIYTIKITNKGPDIASNIVVTDIINNGFIINNLQSSLGNILRIGNTVTWAIPTLNVGQKEIATIEVVATNQVCNTYIENIATATCDNNITSPSNATDKTTLYVNCPANTFSDLQLRKTAPKRNFAVGEQIPFTIKIKNNGPDIATNIIMTDMIDSRLNIISLQTLSGTISQNGNLVIWTIPSLGVGTEIIATITAIAQVGVSNVSIANGANVICENILVNPNNSKDSTSVYISS